MSNYLKKLLIASAVCMVVPGMALAAPAASKKAETATTIPSQCQALAKCLQGVSLSPMTGAVSCSGSTWRYMNFHDLSNTQNGTWKYAAGYCTFTNNQQQQVQFIK
jgi:hypothetical protein